MPRVFNPETGEWEVKPANTPTEEAVIFDPNTGELKAVSIESRATRSVENIPMVYMLQEEAEMLFQNYSDSCSPLHITAFEIDGGDVFHVYTSLPPRIPAGQHCGCIIQLYPYAPSDLSQLDLGIVSLIREKFYITNGSEKHCVIILLVKEEHQLNHLVFISLSKDGPLARGHLELIPARSELYSRSKGLLETSALGNQKVGVVGVGSGGSTVAVELAKAGVGNFVLIDFDRLELGNISRHVCGLEDLGRYKTKAVRDMLYCKNPYVRVENAEFDINQHLEETVALLKQCQLIIAGTDNNRSRFNLNSIALQYRIPAIFGRALTRAAGGDVLRVRPYQGPCLACVFIEHFSETYQEEISQFRQARPEAPAYMKDKEVNATIQVGLSSDILPIANMVVKLALIELSRGKQCGITSLESDLVSDFYIWANRRELVYENWPKMEYGSRTLSILRWYGAKWKRNKYCLVCGEQSRGINPDDNIFAGQ
jgi:molybdopterin/thiamine biosynthesis adenylyltransferase